MVSSSPVSKPCLSRSAPLPKTSWKNGDHSLLWRCVWPAVFRRGKSRGLALLSGMPSLLSWRAKSGSDEQLRDDLWGIGIIDDSFQRTFVYIYCHEGWRVYSKSTLINDNAVNWCRLHFMVTLSYMYGENTNMRSLDVIGCWQHQQHQHQWWT